MKAKAQRKADLVSTNYGSIISIRPQTSKGRLWMYANVPDSHARMNRSVDCDHRCGVDILQGAYAAGLRLQDSTTGAIAS